MTTPGQKTESPAKLVGMTSDQIIVDIEAKRRLFFAETPDLQEQMEQALPCDAHVTFVNNVITDFQVDKWITKLT